VACPSLRSRVSCSPYFRCISTTNPLLATIGIRREDKNRWERRVPLSPDHVQTLVDQGIDVVVQPSSLRIFDNDSYSEAGAVVKEDISDADVILAVKEVPEELLIPNKTYMFFSHTIKAQRANMPMLDTIISKNIRLIDYERIVNSAGQRLVRFGRYAGVAGMIDSLRALGNRLLHLKFSTPFLHLGYTHMYASEEAAKQAVKAIGEEILLKGVPKELGPMVFVFTGGEGSCAKGAREIFELLPHKYVTPEELPSLLKSKDPGHRFRLYGCKVGSADYMVPKDPNMRYNRTDYYTNPENYECNFASKIAPYASVIVNNTYWDQQFPRLITRQQMKDLWRKRSKGRLLAVADISCDVNGSIESMAKTTNVDEPVFVFDPATNNISDSIDASGILFLAVDNLPTELPKEASCYFGNLLMPYLPQILKLQPNISYEEMSDALPPEVYPAVITANGQLTPPYEYINSLRKQHESLVNKILVLGAGYVTPGLISLLSQDSRNHITIASDSLEEAQKLAKIANIKAIELDVLKEGKRTESYIAGSDVVISVLPQFFHVEIAKMCIKHKRDMVTASYIKPAMQELDQAAKDAGIVILNEIGLDPGIDHMSALKMINEIKEKKGKVMHFRSTCGGLPAPEYADNPFYYKFSWSPRGVLEAGKNAAKYLENGEVIDVPGNDLFKHVNNTEIHPCFSMEVLPNRDSTSYIKTYGLDDAATVFRGTLRYKGYSTLMWAVKKLGLLSSETDPNLDPTRPKYSNWPEYLCAMLNVSRENLKTAIVDHVRSGDDTLPKYELEYYQKRLVRSFEWLGLFDETTEFNPNSTAIDTLCNLLMDRLVFERQERDMILLQHELDVEWEGGQQEKLKSTLIAFGDAAGGETAMAKTVGYPLGIAAELIANKKITSRGVIGPTTPEIYIPILGQLKSRGLWFVETS